MYFLQVLFQLVVGVNFIVAILERQYREISRQKSEFIYKRKAELNLECYQLLKHVTYLDPFRLLVFTYQVSNEENRLKIHQREEEFIDYVQDVSKNLHTTISNYKAKQKILHSNVRFVKGQQKQLKKQFETECKYYGKLIDQDKTHIISTLKKEHKYRKKDTFTPTSVDRLSMNSYRSGNNDDSNLVRSSNMMISNESKD